MVFEAQNIYYKFFIEKPLSSLKKNLYLVIVLYMKAIDLEMLTLYPTNLLSSFIL